MTGPTTYVPGAPRAIPWPDGAGMTHLGRVRDRNEDSILTDPGGTLWAVADGMGGYDLGDVASDMVIDALAALGDDGDPVTDLSDGLYRANTAVYARARDVGSGRMGATVVAAMIRRAVVHLVWAGDSRAYLLRGGLLRMLTRDHTVVQHLVEAGALSADQAERHPESHVVTRAVGMGPGFEVESVSVPLVPGDRLLLCSDGLHGCLSDSQIATLLATGRPPADSCKALIAAALEAGAPDNVSVIVVDLREG